ncbi:MAG: hypothetical protein H7Z75_07665 [Ferruginibacter sp.]|nr:hypothetical protein [Cytophagales bacterium]
MPAYGRAKNIGLLFDSNYEELEARSINYLYRRLREGNKNVKALTHFPRERSSPFDFRFDFFTDKDLTLVGKIKSNAVDIFVDTEFDFLYCIDQRAFLPFEFILARSKAKFRVGIYHEQKPDFLELMVNPLQDQDLTDVIDQMLAYTKRISESESVK